MSHRKSRAVERLEPRALLSAVTWDAGGDGANWLDPANWSNDQLPGIGDDVTVDVPGSPTIRVPNAIVRVHSLDVAERLDVTAHIVVYGDLTVRNTVKLTEDASGARGELSFVETYQTLNAAHQIGGTGRIELTGVAQPTGVYLDGNDGSSLTIGSGVTVALTAANARGNVIALTTAGRIANYGTLETAAAGAAFNVGQVANSSGYRTRFDNYGTLRVANNARLLACGLADCPGPIVVDNGILDLEGITSPAAFGAIDRTGGEVLFYGQTTVPAGQTLTLTARTGPVVLGQNGYLFGPGKVAATDGVGLVGRYGTLGNGLVLAAPLSIDAGLSVTLRNKVTLDGLVTGPGRLGDQTFNSPTREPADIYVGPNAQLFNVPITSNLVLADPGRELVLEKGLSVVGTVRLEGADARLVARGSQTWDATAIRLTGAGAGVVVRDGVGGDGGPSPAVLWLGGSLAAVGASGALRADPANAASAAVFASGRITADAADGRLTIDVPLFRNQGVVEAVGGGTVRFAAAPDNYDPATRTLTGGTWAVGAGSALLFPAGVSILVNAASLSFPGGADPSLPAVAPALSALAVNAGRITLGGGYDLTVGAAGTTFRNDNILSVGSGSVLTVAGDLLATGAARTELALAGTPAANVYGRVVVAGTATLGGAVAPLSPGAATGGYPVLAAGAIGGTFASVTQPGQIKVSDWYTPTSVELVAGVQAPTAGGPYVVPEGGSGPLAATAVARPGTTLAAYEWDLDYAAGAPFAVDATGATPTFDAAALDGARAVVVGVRVRDADGKTSGVRTATVTVANVAPTARVSAGPPVRAGTPVTVTFSGMADAAPADLAAGLRYSVDFNNDGDFNDATDVLSSASPTASFLFAAPGAYTVRARVADKDGGFTDYTASAVVVPAGAPAPDGAPHVLSTVVGDGTAGRSMVKTLTVGFDQPVSLDSATVTLARRSDGAGGAATDATAALAAPTSADGGRTWMFRFAAGAFTEAGGSLKDGVYTLAVHAGGTAGLAGGLAADAAVTFHRLAGDYDGNRVVNNADYLRFRAAFGSSAGAPGYNPVFDFDGNGAINNNDYLQFRARFGTTFDYM